MWPFRPPHERPLHGNVAKVRNWRKSAVRLHAEHARFPHGRRKSLPEMGSVFENRLAGGAGGNGRNPAADSAAPQRRLTTPIRPFEPVPRRRAAFDLADVPSCRHEVQYWLYSGPQIVTRSQNGNARIHRSSCHDPGASSWSGHGHVWNREARLSVPSHNGSARSSPTPPLEEPEGASRARPGRHSRSLGPAVRHSLGRRSASMWASRRR